MNIFGIRIIAIILILAFILGFAACGKEDIKDEPNQGVVDEPVTPDEPMAPEDPIKQNEPMSPEDPIKQDEAENPPEEIPVTPVVEPIKEELGKEPVKEVSEKEPVKEEPIKEPIKEDPPVEEQPKEDPVTQDPPEVTSLSLEYMTEKRAEYIVYIHKNISMEDAVYLANLFEEFAGTRDYIDTETLMGIARLESGFQNIIGENYAGPMQVSLKYGQLAGYTLEQLAEPRYSIEYAMTILDFGHDKFPGNLSYVLLSFNQGYYGLKGKLDRGEEINFGFVERVERYAEEIRARY